jgi:hypothetical protein
LQEARELAESAYSLRADVLRDLLQRCTSEINWNLTPIITHPQVPPGARRPVGQ